MPKVTRGNEGTAKKRSRKNNLEAAPGAQPVAVQQDSVREGRVLPAVPGSPSLEEKIRIRAYELYLQRAGQSGSPEQDWLRAKEEICGQQQVA